MNTKTSNLGRHWSRPQRMPASKHDLEKATKQIMAKVSELSAALAQITAQVNKSRDEIVARINALEEALKNVDLPAEADDALAALKAAVQAIDDVTPDQS